MEYVEVHTQAELDKALKRKNAVVLIRGRGSFTVRGSSQVRACDSSQVRACDSSQVTAYDSSQVTACGSSQVTAYDSSQVRACDSSQVRACDSSQVTAYGSSQVTAYDSSQVTAYGSSQVTAYGSSQVRACGSSQVRACDSSQVTAYDSSQVTAYGSSQVTACGSSQVRASKCVAVTKAADSRAKVSGGVLIEIPKITTAIEWCDFYGVEIKRGDAVLFKALDDDYSTENARPKGIFYTPGSKPKAPDWDGGRAECGGGLHFSPRPVLALKFNTRATRYVACPVKLSEIVVHENATYPDKVKAPRVAGKIYEVDIDGVRL